MAKTKNVRVRKEREFSRSEQTHPVTLSGGFKTQIAYCLKYGSIAQMYWYTVQMECKGWMMFDVRSYDKDGFPIDVVIPDHPQCLPFVAQLIESKTIDEIRKIACPLY